MKAAGTLFWGWDWPAFEKKGMLLLSFNHWTEFSDFFTKLGSLVSAWALQSPILNTLPQINFNNFFVNFLALVNEPLQIVTHFVPKGMYEWKYVAVSDTPYLRPMPSWTNGLPWKSVLIAYF